MKKFTILITTLLLGFFIAEAQTQVKSQNPKNGIIKPKIEKVATNKNAGFNPDGYCTASGGCDEYITQVVLGNINNSTLCNQYSYIDFVSADIPLNWYDIITVTNGNPYDPDECGIWVDWNRDEDFDDPGESISVTGSPGQGPYTAIISPPAGTTLGTCRLRIRITYSQTPSPCGADQYGEVEDYLINVTPEIPNEWTGDVDGDWNEGGNWLFGHVPYYYEDVVITTNGQYHPVIYGSDAECANLTINAGAELEVNNTNLNVYGNMTIYGQLDMTNDNGSINCQGNVDWNNNSTADINVYSDIYVEGHWFFNSGSDVQIDNGIVHLIGTQPAQIKNKSATSYVNSLYIGKTAAVTTSIAADANYPFVINDYLNIQYSNNVFENSTDQDIIVRGNFYHAGEFDFSGGDNTFVFDGNVQSLSGGGYFSDKFHSLKISPATSVTIYENIVVEGDLIIESGVLDIHSSNITIGGDWNNTIGPSAFEEGLGKVVFQGTTNQFCSSEEFNKLELNNPAGALYVNGTNVVCASYDWTAGAIDVWNGGTFTANDLIDDGIYGKYVLSDASSTINLTNTNGFVDLNGEIHINDGIMNVYGGTTPSYWPYDADATIFMSGGVLDFHDQGIYVWNSGYSLTENITGGTVRTSQGFIGGNAEFTPSGGTFEFYGSGDFFISQENGCTLFNVNINKSTKEGSSVSSGTPIIDKRSGKVLSDGGKSNTITLSSSFGIANDLTITSGELKLNGHYLTVYNNCDVYGILTMDNSADVLSVGQEYFDHLYFASGSAGNISNGTINIYGWITTGTGCSFTPTIDNTVVLVGESGGGFSNYEPGAAYGNVEVAKDYGCTAYINSGSTQPIIVNGDFTINPSNVFAIFDKSMIVHGMFADASSSEIYVDYLNKSSSPGLSSYKVSGQSNTKYFGGYLELDNDFTLNGLLYVGDGNVLLHGDFQAASTSTITINGGSFIDDAINLPWWEYIEGSFNMTDGLFELANNSLWFRYSAVTNISGGTMRFGEGFCASPGVFNPTGGEVELTAALPVHPLCYCYSGSSFYNLKINSQGGNDTISYVTDITVTNDLTIESGYLECGYYPNKSSKGNNLPGTTTAVKPNMAIPAAANDLPVTSGSGNNTKAVDWQLYIGGNWSDNSGGFIPNEGAVTFNGTNPSYIYADESFYDLAVDNEALYIGEGITLSVENGVTVNSGGTFEIQGTVSNPAIVTKTTGSTGYSFVVNSGGTISADHAIFEYMGTLAGITILDGAFIDPVNSFNACTFRNGSSLLSMSSLLTIENNQVLTINDAVFQSSQVPINVNKEVDQGHITFVDYSGNLSGAAYELDPYNRIDWVVPSFDLDLTAFLEGPFKVSDMGAELTDIPLSQPYNISPWNYAGTESVSSIPNANVVDWVLVELRDAPSASGAGSSTRLARQAGFLLKDGSIVANDGSSLLTFTNSIANSLFVVVWHRNHLGILSANPLTESAGVYTYDFTTNINKAYLSGQKSINGKATLFGGDIDANGTVNNTDKIIWSGVAGTKGYQPADTDLNGQVDNKDKNDIWDGNENEQTKVPN